MSKDEQPTRGGFVPESSDSYPRILPEKPLLINGFSGRARRMAAGSPSQRQEPSEGVFGRSVRSVKRDSRCTKYAGFSNGYTRLTRGIRFDSGYFHAATTHP